MSLQVGPYVLPRGGIVPYEETSTTRQTRLEAMNGAMHVIDAWDYELKKITVRDSREVCLNVKGFLKNACRYAAFPFTLVDGFGTSFRVRLWDRNIKVKTIAADVAELVFTVRVEVAP